MPIITISHEAFGDGRAVAERVAAILGYRCISREENPRSKGGQTYFVVTSAEHYIYANGR